MICIKMRFDAIIVALQASSFMMFPDMNTACRAASVLRTETAVDAVEVFDRAALRECEADEGLTRLVVDIKGADPGAAALLIECRGEDAETLQVCSVLQQAMPLLVLWWTCSMSVPALESFVHNISLHTLHNMYLPNANEASAVPRRGSRDQSSVMLRYHMFQLSWLASALGGRLIICLIWCLTVAWC